MHDNGDPTELARRQRQKELNEAAEARAELEAKYGQVWDTKQLTEDFEVKAFLAPFVVVQRRRDKAIGSLEFQHHPRFYFNWKEDTKDGITY